MHEEVYGEASTKKTHKHFLEAGDTHRRRPSTAILSLVYYEVIPEGSNVNKQKYIERLHHSVMQ